MRGPHEKCVGRKAHTCILPKARKPRVSTSLNTRNYASVLQITSQVSLLPMGCFQSKAVGIDVSSTLPVATTAPAVEARMTPAPAPALPIVEESSPATVSRRPSRRTSQREHQPAHQEESISQARKRAASAPQQLPQATSSSSQSYRPRAKSAGTPHGHGRSQSNTPVLGQCRGWLGYPYINPH